MATPTRPVRRAQIRELERLKRRHDALAARVMRMVAGGAAPADVADLDAERVGVLRRFVALAEEATPAEHWPRIKARFEEARANPDLAEVAAALAPHAGVTESEMLGVMDMARAVDAFGARARAGGGGDG